MSAVFLLVGVLLAGALLFGGFQTQSPQVRIASLVAACVVLFIGFTLASFRYVGENSLGVVTKNIGFTSLPPGKIVATAGEKGPQAAILSPGWHPWYWPFIYDVDVEQLTVIPEGKVGMLERRRRPAAAARHDLRPGVGPGHQGPHGGRRAVLPHRRPRLQGAPVVGPRTRQVSDQPEVVYGRNCAGYNDRSCHGGRREIQRRRTSSRTDRPAGCGCRRGQFQISREGKARHLARPDSARPKLSEHQVLRSHQDFHPDARGSLHDGTGSARWDR